MSKKLKAIPIFRNEDEEQKFWSRSDSADYFDWKKADVAILSRLKPSTKTISLRLPESLIDDLRVLANKRDVPYQSLIKIILKDRIDRELKKVI